MRRRPFGSRLVVTMAVVAVCSIGAAGVRSANDTLAVSPGKAQAAAARPLHTAVMDPLSLNGTDAGRGLDNVRRAGARFLRLGVNWENVAPPGAQKPAGFDARDPSESQYRWANADAEVKAAVAKGLTPIVYVATAPPWAQDGIREDGPLRPSPSAYGDFATAAAKRYSGRFRGLPRVRYWQVWNEANLSTFLTPQTQNGKPVSPEWYRSLVNSMARAVHAVRRDNVVIAGGLAPYGGDAKRIRPLRFMREMLCMAGRAKPRATCKARSEFDVWAHHTYAYGGPTYKARHPDDVSIGDLGEMRRLLTAAVRARHVVSRREPAFWVTEFSYDSKPPDKKGVPLALHTRWVSESLYRMWTDGVSLVTWFLIRDEPTDLTFQSGLYFRGRAGHETDRPKPALRAFRFPFVAFRERGGAISYWGRTPAGVKKAVVVEQQGRGGWQRLAGPPVNRYGIFSGEVTKAKGRGPLRARLANGSDFSVPFSLKVPKDRRFCLFGTVC